MCNFDLWFVLTGCLKSWALSTSCQPPRMYDYLRYRQTWANVLTTLVTATCLIVDTVGTVWLLCQGSPSSQCFGRSWWLEVPVRLEGSPGHSLLAGNFGFYWNLMSQSTYWNFGQSVQHLSDLIQSDNGTIVAFINQGGTRGHSAAKEGEYCQLWKTGGQIFSAISIWTWKNGLCTQKYSKTCYTDKGCQIDNLALRFNIRLDRFESRFKDSLAEAVDVQWYGYTPIYTFPHLKLPPQLCWIAMKDILMVLKAPDWPRRAWYTDLHLLFNFSILLLGCLAVEAPVL